MAENDTALIAFCGKRYTDTRDVDRTALKEIGIYNRKLQIISLLNHCRNQCLFKSD